MQTHSLIGTLALCGLLGLAAGCGKKEQTEQPAQTGGAEPQIKVDLSGAKEAAQKAAAGAGAAVTQAVQSVAAKAGEDTGNAAQKIIDTAKKLVKEGKWQEVAQTLNQLQGVKLTPDQEKALLDLKAQLEKMVQEAMGKTPALPGGLTPPK